MDQVTTNTLIIGASAAGLACAARLKRYQVPFEIIEQHDQVGHAWRHHYNRLHLHTPKTSSSLPYLKFPREVPQYPARAQVITYLETYCKQLGIAPRYNTAAEQLNRSNHGWTTKTNTGDIISENLIICTGNTKVPKKVDKPGMETFPGRVIHSSEYTNGEPFKDQNVLVVGFGNSACEIAICLHEHGASPAMSVRSPVNVIPRDIMGIPVLKLGILLSKLPPALADQLNRPLMNLLVGDIEKYGLKKLPYGPMEQIAKDHSIPLLDIGTMNLIKRGLVRIYGDISSIREDIVYFENDQQQFDTIIMATGYRTGLENLITLPSERLADIQMKQENRKLFGQDNLYFCGFFVASTGMLREINRESFYIMKDIVKKISNS